MNIVLVEPEIPQNTGNIIRTCVCTNSTLHMIRPFGFVFTKNNIEKYVKKAGMDYIKHANILIYDNFEEYLEKNNLEDMFFFTTKATKAHSDVVYSSNSHLIFGPESRGLNEKIRNLKPENNVRIPMLNLEYARSLNLANSVSIGVYEALRQVNYESIYRGKNEHTK